MNWTVIGGAEDNASALLDRILISGGTEVLWSLDELRIGTSFGAVVSNVAPPTVP